MTKTSLLTTALGVTLGVAALVPQAAKASDGTITFSGQLTAATCKVNVNGGSASGTITLPTMQTSDFGSAGKAAGFTAFTINVSDCSGTGASTKVLPYFEHGPNTDLSTGYLKNSDQNGATNVEVMLSNSNSIASSLNLQNEAGQQNAGTPELTSGDPTFTYYASYISTGKVTAGAVSTSVQYSLTYP